MGWVLQFHVLIPTWTANQTVMFFPVQFKAVETYHVFKVHENNPQRIQLVCQPKICKANAMKWGCHHSKLEEKVQTVIPLDSG